MSLLKVVIPSWNSDACEECGQYPKNIENGVKHPYCSRACAKKAASAGPALSAQSQRATINNECGLRPKAVEQGYKHPYCSRTCAQNSKLRPPVNVRSDLCPGCGQYRGGIRYTYCSKTCARKYSTSNPVEWSRPRHRSLQNEHGDLTIDSTRTQSSILETRHSGVPRRPRILFYHKHDLHYGFTNFSYNPVVYKGKIYPTGEHLFQSFKVCVFQRYSPEIAEHIRTYSDKPSVAFSEARQYQHEVRSDWNEVKIEKMDTTLWHKFTQHHDLKVELMATGDAELVEDSDKDAFWGVGPDGRGYNELGKALERLRAKLRSA